MEKLSFDQNWKFQLEPVQSRPAFLISRKNEEVTGRAGFSWNDNDWEDVTLPHDWAFSLPYGREFDRGHGHVAVNTLNCDHADEAIVPEPVSTVGWYRKHFTVPAQARDKRIMLFFDGVFRDSTVYINGQLFERHMSGYTPFSCDITNHIRFGEENLVAVRCDASQTEGWWYEGAGIYRHVWLGIADPLHAAEDGVAIRTSISGQVEVEAEIVSQREETAQYCLGAQIFRGDTLVSEMQSEMFCQEPWTIKSRRVALSVPDPALWSPDAPNLYHCVVRILENGAVTDTHAEVFGFRECVFDPDRGFFLNGKRLQIQGACVHQDFACVGVALPDDIHSYKIQKLREMGSNAYRSSHHAPAKEIIDACNRLGMLVMDENRMFGSTPECLGQMEALVRRDRNAPCVILWSLGNEEHSVQNRPQGAKMARDMVRLIRRLDPTRAVTYGGNNAGRYAGINQEVDVRGFNYLHISQQEYLEAYHRDHPEQPLVGSEETSGLYQRGVVHTDFARYQVSGYDENTAPWGSTAEGFLRYYHAHPFIAGGFIWTGFDYTGEPTPYSEYNTVTSFGAMDLCGWPKDIYHYYRAWWTKEPALHLMPHWNHKPGEAVRVVAYTNLPEVELFCNGSSLGRQRVEQFGSGQWEVPFTPGYIEAVAYRDGKPCLHTRRETAGQADHLLLRKETAEQGTILVTAQIVDAKSNPVPDANQKIRFRVTGGKLLGLGNGNPSSYEPAQFKPVELRQPITDWTAEGKAWDMDADRSTSLYDWKTEHLVTREEPKPEFYDRTRLVWQMQTWEQQVRHFQCDVETEPGRYRLDMERINGAYTVSLNGETVWEQKQSSGLPQSCWLDIQPGVNRLEVTVACEDRPGANGGIFGKTELVSFREPDWVRRAHMGMCMAMIRPEQGVEPTVVADLLKDEEI